MQKIEFLYRSIEDTQSTIRAIDIKAGFIFIVIFFPIVSLEKVLDVTKGLFGISHSFLWLITPIFIFWLLSIYLLFKTLVSISNPADKIRDEKPSGIFYGAQFFQLSKIDYLFNFPIKSLKNIKDIVNKIPKDDTNLIQELVFEKMKLAYIRDIKIHRLDLLFKTTFLWLILGSISWILFLILKA